MSDDIFDAEPIEDRVAALSGEPPLALALRNGGQIQQLRTDFVTALQVAQPRDIRLVTKRAMDEAELLAERGFYSFPVKGGRVEGGSIELAMCLHRAWGNCHADCDVVEAAENHVTLRARFIDLESGATVARAFRGYVAPAPAKFASDPAQRERWYSMQFEANQSKAIRNVILRGVPAWLRDEAFRRAKESAGKLLLKGTSLPEARAKIVDWYRSIGKSQTDLERLRDRPMGSWTANDCVELKSTWTAIKVGDISVEEVFASFEDDTPAKPKQTGPTPADRARVQAQAQTEQPLAPVQETQQAMTAEQLEQEYGSAIAALGVCQSRDDLKDLQRSLPRGGTVEQKKALTEALKSANARFSNGNNGQQALV